MVIKIFQRVAQSTISHIKRAPFFNSVAYQELARENNHQDIIIRENRFHILEAVEWIKRAHDATSDGGVSRGFSAEWNSSFQSRGWQPSYPETTGYIIPTILDCAVYLADDDLKQRAIVMADWEIKIQMESGAVMGGVVNAQPSPAVFNTGQVMLGWLRVFQETKDVKYLNACKKAGDYLLRIQDSNGGWTQSNSLFANPNATTYNARVGWALILLGLETKDRRYTDAGERNIAYSINQQNENGWFRQNCLTDPVTPLLHTICYAIEGVLGAAEILHDKNYLNKASCSARALLACLRENGSIAGRLDERWKDAVGWSCLTGDAQLAAIWLRIYGETQDKIYQSAAHRVLQFLKSTQNCTSVHPGLRGGIKGSYPFNGEYGKFQILNWATKFYIDALLLDEKFASC